MAKLWLLRVAQDINDFLAKWQRVYGDPLTAWWWEWFETTPQYQRWRKLQHFKS